MSRRETGRNGFKAKLVSRLKIMFPGCMIFSLDANATQGIPDLLVLYRDKWAALECKAYASAPRRPNQEYYVDILNDMSFSSFVYPENEEEVLHELQSTFGH